MNCRIPLQITVVLLIAAFLSSCASTGPKVSRQELKSAETAFEERFLQASEKWLPRVYRVGYRLITSHVPEHGDAVPKFNFAGVGVTELKDYGRTTYGIDDEIKGVLVLGTYPESKAEGLDLRAGDVIIEVDGKKTKSLGSYFKRVRKTERNEIDALVWRDGDAFAIRIPLEKVYYNAQFFLSPTPNFDANAMFSKINVGVGALRYCRNEDELAVIMGHELAHTTLKHSLKKLGVSTSAGLAIGATAAVINAFTFPGVGDLALYPVARATNAAVSRRYEREADYYGMQHAFHAGYNVESGSKVFSRLATDAPGFQVLAYTFSSHPKSPERFLRLEKINEEFKQQYPEMFPAEKTRDWDIIVPYQSGESLDEAIEKLLQAREELASEAAEVVRQTDDAVMEVGAQPTMQLQAAGDAADAAKPLAA